MVCSELADGLAETAVAFAGMALGTGVFVALQLVLYFDRLTALVGLQRVGWQPDVEVSRDLRPFALLAATSVDALPVAAWRWEAGCGTDHCATLSLDGLDALTWVFGDDGVGYLLVSIEA